MPPQPFSRTQSGCRRWLAPQENAAFVLAGRPSRCFRPGLPHSGPRNAGRFIPQDLDLCFGQVFVHADAVVGLPGECGGQGQNQDLRQAELVRSDVEHELRFVQLRLDPVVAMLSAVG